MTRLRIMFDASWITIIVVSVLLLAAEVAGARWPNDFLVTPPTPTPEYIEAVRTDQMPRTLGWQGLLVGIIAIAFFSIKNTLLIRHMGPRTDWLALAIAAMNSTIALLFLLSMATNLFPYWFVTHIHERFWLSNGIQYLMVAALLWGIWQLTNVPPPAIVGGTGEDITTVRTRKQQDRTQDQQDRTHIHQDRIQTEQDAWADEHRREP